MDSVVKNLQHTDESTKTVLQELVDRKLKHQKMKMRHKFNVLLAFIITVMFISNFIISIYGSHGSSFISTYSQFRDDRLSFSLLTLSIVSFTWLKFYKIRLENVKAEYKELRLEVIQKSTDFWNDKDGWENRHKVYSQLKENFDINLFYESD